MRKVIAVSLMCLCAALAVAQTPAPTPSPFSDTTVTFNLSPLMLPGGKTSLSGAETDVLLSLTPSNTVGETTLLSSGYEFIGGRYNRTFPSIGKWLNNLSPNLNGLAFQVGLTASLGVVKIPGATPPKSHWGERAGGFVNYQINNTWGMGLEVQWNNMVGYARNTPSFAFGPNFHF